MTPEPTSSRPVLSVVVCTYNGERSIAACLAALQAQTICSQIELLVVDDGSQDRTAELIAAQGLTAIRMVPNGGLSAARNAGIVAARGAIIAFTDDDCVVDSRWAEQLVTAWHTAGDDVVGIGGEVDALSTDTFARRYLDRTCPLAPLELGLGEARSIGRRLAWYFNPTRGSGVRRVFSLVGANMSFRAAALRGVGGFDPVIRFGGDEEDLCTRLRERFGAHCLVVDPAIRIRHDFAPGLAGSLRRGYGYGFGIGRDAARRGTLPMPRPGVTLTVLSAGLIGLIHPGAGVVAALGVPLLVWRRWLRPNAAARLEAVLYPYVALAHEAFTTVGIAAGWGHTTWRGPR